MGTGEQSTGHTFHRRAPNSAARPVKIAIVHYWLVDRRGGERVVEALCELYPQADLFTNVYDPAPFARTLARHRVKTTFVNSLPFARQMLEPYLPLMPLALEQLDLRDYDLVISSESGPAKGVVVRPDALHVCYCHSPMRYAWDLYPQYLAEAGVVKRMAMRPLMHYLRLWDQASAQRPDAIVANSEHTRRRIAKYWRREATVIAPPVDTDRLSAARTGVQPGDYYLCAGHLMGYKRVDLAVDAFNTLGLPLVVAGTGPELAALQRRARPNIKFLGWTPDDALARTIAGCKALVFPGEEDFGIVPVEAMSAGRPVIAYGRGGALDSVIDGETGLFFHEPSAESLANAVRTYEVEYESFDADHIAAYAASFDREHFKARFADFVREQLTLQRPAEIQRAVNALA
jgi:glycosyltransferase involved in cell wall biosynthesis